MYLLFSLVNAKKIFCSSSDLSVSNNLFIRFPFYFFSLASALDVGFLRGNKSIRPNGRNLVCKRISPLKHSWISGFCVHTLTVRKTVLVMKILLYCSYSSFFLQRIKAPILFLHILRVCKFLLNEKEMERFPFSLVLILFVSCGSVNSGNGKRVDVSGIIYRLIGIHVNSSFSLGDKNPRFVYINKSEKWHRFCSCSELLGSRLDRERERERWYACDYGFFFGKNTLNGLFQMTYCQNEVSASWGEIIQVISSLPKSYSGRIFYAVIIFTSLKYLILIIVFL
jgi:hypothetical protein